MRYKYTVLGESGEKGDKGEAGSNGQDGLPGMKGEPGNSGNISSCCVSCWLWMGYISCDTLYYMQMLEKLTDVT